MNFDMEESIISIILPSIMPLLGILLTLLTLVVVTKNSFKLGGIKIESLEVFETLKKGIMIITILVILILIFGIFYISGIEYLEIVLLSLFISIIVGITTIVIIISLKK